VVDGLHGSRHQISGCLADRPRQCRTLVGIQAAQVIHHHQQLLSAHLPCATPQPLRKHVRLKTALDHCTTATKDINSSRDKTLLCSTARREQVAIPPKPVAAQGITAAPPKKYRKVSVGDTSKSLAAQGRYRNNKKYQYKYIYIYRPSLSLSHVLSQNSKKAILRYFPCPAVDLGVSGWYRGIAQVILRWYDWDLG